MKNKSLLILILITSSNLKTIWDWEVYDLQSQISYPWYSTPFIEELKKWNVKNWKIFEWRTDNRHSTLWWAKNCLEITTIEDQNPLRKSNSELTEDIARLGLTNIIQKKRPISIYQVTIPIFGKININPECHSGQDSPYVKAIDETSDLYDCILIDGMHPNDCAKIALKHIKLNGIIIINNVNRYVSGRNTNPAIILLSKYPSRHFSEQLAIDVNTTSYWIIDQLPSD